MVNMYMTLTLDCSKNKDWTAGRVVWVEQGYQDRRHRANNNNNNNVYGCWFCKFPLGEHVHAQGLIGVPVKDTILNYHSIRTALESS